jgi:DNA-binding transcriptional LysR family regulator
MELRQLRYFVTLAEELHFGRAAAREHMAQSAVSQQLQRLERELGVRLIERSTHHVRLTPGGRAFLPEARRALAQAQRAAAAAQRAAVTAPTVRVGIVDASYDSMPSILRHAQERHPDLVIHQIEAGVPQQCQELLDGRLDVGLGRACLAPPQIASTLVRLDPLGVLVPEGHRFAASAGVPVASLADERLLLATEERAHPPRAFRQSRRSSGGSWSTRCPSTRGPCCGGPETIPSRSTPSWPALAGCRTSSGGSDPTAGRRPRPAMSSGDQLN